MNNESSLINLPYILTLVSLLITGFLAWQVQHLSKKRNQIDLKLKWIDDLRSLFSQWLDQLESTFRKTLELRNLSLAAKEKFTEIGNDELGINIEFEEKIKRLYGYTSLEQLNQTIEESSKLRTTFRKISMQFSSKDKRFISLREGHNYSLKCLKMIVSKDEQERKQGREAFQTWQVFISSDMQDIIQSEWRNLVGEDEKPKEYWLSVVISITYLLVVLVLFYRTY